MIHQPSGIEALVCKDIAARQKVGLKKYGCSVAESPDDMLVHAYQEVLDLAVYLRAEMERQKRFTTKVSTDPPKPEEPTPLHVKTIMVLVVAVAVMLLAFGIESFVQFLMNLITEKQP